MPRSASDRPITLRLQLPRNTLKIVGLAFVAGLLCFVVVWMNARKSDFYTPGPAPSAPPAAELAPLPQPLPAADGSSEMPEAKPAAYASESQATAEIPAAAPAEAPAAATPPLTPAIAVHSEPRPAATHASTHPQPMAGQTPAPRYPRGALRRGEGGTVVVRVDVDANGLPSQVSLIQRSGTRALDRAALKAARDWRFHPAQQNGQPIAASIDIPFDFKPAQ